MALGKLILIGGVALIAWWVIGRPTSIEELRADIDNITNQLKGQPADATATDPSSIDNTNTQDNTAPDPSSAQQQQDPSGGQGFGGGFGGQDQSGGGGGGQDSFGGDSGGGFGGGGGGGDFGGGQDTSGGGDSTPSIGGGGSQSGDTTSIPTQSSTPFSDGGNAHDSGGGGGGGGVPQPPDTSSSFDQTDTTPQQQTQRDSQGKKPPHPSAVQAKKGEYSGHGKYKGTPGFYTVRGHHHCFEGDAGCKCTDCHKCNCHGPVGNGTHHTPPHAVLRTQAPATQKQHAHHPSNSQVKVTQTSHRGNNFSSTRTVNGKTTVVTNNPKHTKIVSNHPVHVVHHQQHPVHHKKKKKVVHHGNLAYTLGYDGQFHYLESSPLSVLYHNPDY